MAHTQERDTAQSINTLRNGSSAAQFERAERETLLNQYPEASWVIPRGAPNQWRTQERDTAESKTHRNGRKTTLLNQYPEASWVIPRRAPKQWRTQERPRRKQRKRHCSINTRREQSKKETLLNQIPEANKERDTAQSVTRSKQRKRHCSINTPKQASKDPEANWVINTSNPETPILKQPIQ